MAPEIRKVLDLFAAVSANPNTPVGAALLRDFRHALIEMTNEVWCIVNKPFPEDNIALTDMQAEIQNYTPRMPDGH